MNKAQERELGLVLARWGLVLDGLPMQSPTGCVAFAHRTTNGQPVVVKVADPGSGEMLGVAALRHYQAKGSVAVLDHIDGAALLERACPGWPLSELVLAGRDDEATGHLCAVAAALHNPALPAETSGMVFPRVEDWGSGFARYRRSGDGSLPAALVERAGALFAELAASQDSRRLLHGDLHHDNILWDERRGWLAIDPKGVLGEAAYEFGAALRNPASAPTLVASPAVADRRSHIIAERLGLDRWRVVAWAFAQAVLAAVWAWEDGQQAEWALAAAAALRPTV
jgi:streptomycin 6-kinase